MEVHQEEIREEHFDVGGEEVDDELAGLDASPLDLFEGEDDCDGYDDGNEPDIIPVAVGADDEANFFDDFDQGEDEEDQYRDENPSELSNAVTLPPFKIIDQRRRKGGDEEDELDDLMKSALNSSFSSLVVCEDDEENEDEGRTPASTRRAPETPDSSRRVSICSRSGAGTGYHNKQQPQPQQQITVRYRPPVSAPPISHQVVSPSSATACVVTPNRRHSDTIPKNNWQKQQQQRHNYSRNPISPPPYSATTTTTVAAVHHHYHHPRHFRHQSEYHSGNNIHSDASSASSRASTPAASSCGGEGSGSYYHYYSPYDDNGCCDGDDCATSGGMSSHRRFSQQEGTSQGCARRSSCGEFGCDDVAARAKYRQALSRFLRSMSLSEYTREHVVKLRRSFHHVYYSKRDSGNDNVYSGPQPRGYEEDNNDLLSGFKSGRSMEFRASRRALRSSIRRELDGLAGSGNSAQGPPPPPLQHPPYHHPQPPPRPRPFAAASTPSGGYYHYRAYSS